MILGNFSLSYTYLNKTLLCIIIADLPIIFLSFIVKSVALKKYNSLNHRCMMVYCHLNGIFH